MTTATTPTTRAQTSWLAGGQLLDALTARDFTALHQSLADDVRLRALVPPGPFEVSGAEAVTGQFRTWFGGDDSFELVATSLGRVGDRLYLRWQVRMQPTGDTAAARIAEQHVFATVSDRIDSLDLVCSGWQADPGRLTDRSR
ncbi:nuclear transport factor 2 family protein [Skermania sp. ID1734]|uniref:nuclear transport factor 2 family protein n=1 Tax=Skermania sp. ID1734 TaxID=2597516 RepID=UPI00117E380D|nr:nuclear transport factor 2 family protein [Skermania sp. ID1734]TSD99772.1 nuclear transport factor 2 family protein [Skermania sp. ID1734]